MMPSTKSQAAPPRAAAAGTGIRTLGLRSEDPIRMVQRVRKGFTYSCLVRFQKATGMSWEQVSRFVGIPKRTLTRRQNEGRLHSDESDRVLRASRVFEMAVDLFEGDVEAATQWLRAPQHGLGGEIPLDFASTDIGAREVEFLIARLEHGVFT